MLIVFKQQFVKQMGPSESKNIWHEEYILNSSPTANPLLIKDKSTGSRCQLYKIVVTEDHRMEELDRVQKRYGKDMRFVTPLLKWRRTGNNNICGNNWQLEVLFGQTSPNLAELINFKNSNNQHFTNEEVMYIISRVACGLRQIQNIGQQHGKLDLPNIIVSTDVYLKDPLTLDYDERLVVKNRSSRYLEGYPSPQKLRSMYDSVSSFEELKGDLFSLGIIALQLVYIKEDISRIYYNPDPSYRNYTINFETLSAKIKGINHTQLKNAINLLVSMQSKKRIQIFRVVENWKIDKSRLPMFCPVDDFEYPHNHNGQKPRPFQKPNPIEPIYHPIIDNQVKQPPVSQYISPHHVRYPSDASVNNKEPYQPFNILNSSSQQPLQLAVTPRYSTLTPVVHTFAPAPVPVLFNHSSNPELSQVSAKKYRGSLPIEQTKQIPVLTSSKQTPTFPRYPYYPTDNPSYSSQFKPPYVQSNGLDKLSHIPTFQQFLTKIDKEEIVSPPQHIQRTPIHTLSSDDRIFQTQLVSRHILRKEAPFVPRSALIQNTESIFHEDIKDSDLEVSEYVNTSHHKFVGKKKQQFQGKKSQQGSVKSLSHDNNKQPGGEGEAIESTSVISAVPQPQNQGEQAKAHSKQSFYRHGDAINEQTDANYSSFKTIQVSNPRIQIAEPLQIESSSPFKQILKYVCEEYEMGTKYEGYMKDGIRHGKGRFTYREGSYYDGEWQNNKMHGYGVLYYPSGEIAYEGQWKEDEFDGKGKVYNDQQRVIQGNFDFTDFNQLDQEWVKYEGDLRSDAKEGVGRLVLTNGQVYEGEFSKDMVHGVGVFRSGNSEKRGVWQNGKLKKLL